MLTGLKLVANSEGPFRVRVQEHTWYQISDKAGEQVPLDLHSKVWGDVGTPITTQIWGQIKEAIVETI